MFECWQGQRKRKEDCNSDVVLSQPIERADAQKRLQECYAATFVLYPMWL
jgi:hypothetical protein